MNWRTNMNYRMIKHLDYLFTRLYIAFTEDDYRDAEIIEAQIEAFCEALVMAKIISFKEMFVYEDAVFEATFAMLDRITFKK